MKCALSIAIYPCLSICEAFSILKLGSERNLGLVKLSHGIFTLLGIGRVPLTIWLALFLLLLRSRTHLMEKPVERPSRHAKEAIILQNC